MLVVAREERTSKVTYVSDELRQVILNDGAADQVSARGEVDDGLQRAAAAALLSAAIPVPDGSHDGFRVVSDTVASGAIVAHITPYLFGPADVSRYQNHEIQGEASRWGGEGKRTL